MNENVKARSLSAISALLVLAVFAVGIFCVLLGGASAYRRLIRQDQAAYESRTCVQYLQTKLRQAPAPGAVSIAPFGQGDALVIGQELDGEMFLTRVYCHDGWLMELYSSAEGELSPEDGEKILPAKALALSWQDGLLTAVLTDGSGEEIRLVLSVRGAKVMQP